MSSTPPLPLTYVGINGWLREAKAALAAQQATEMTTILTELQQIKERHAEEKRELMGEYDAYQNQFREEKDNKTDPATFDRIAAHNQKTRLNALVVRLGAEYGISCATPSLVLAEVMRRLAVLADNYRAHGNDRKEIERLERKETKYRVQIMQLGGTLEGVEFIANQVSRKGSDGPAHTAGGRFDDPETLTPELLLLKLDNERLALERAARERDLSPE